jgi:hypothetical protein
MTICCYEQVLTYVRIKILFLSKLSRGDTEFRGELVIQVRQLLSRQTLRQGKFADLKEKSSVA